jgi:hypothetical protein
MNWDKFLTYDYSSNHAFEIFSNQLFERYLKRTYENKLIKFRVINGVGGDGGIEAYGQLDSGELIVIQSKWFRQVIKENEIEQIRISINTALALRPHITTYIVSIPHNLNSLRFVRGKKGQPKKPSDNHEENTIDDFIEEIETQYPTLELVWWFDNDFLTQIQYEDNTGIHKFWFENEIISLAYLNEQFSMQKKAWFEKRYIPLLHAQGKIHDTIDAITFSKKFKAALLNEINSIAKKAQYVKIYCERLIETKLEKGLEIKLEKVREHCIDYANFLNTYIKAIEDNNDKLEISCPAIVIFDELLKDLRNLEFSSLQNPILEKLINAINNISATNILDFFENLPNTFQQNSRLILGDPGTGKTHGLVNAVDIQLNENTSPAIIIQAKGTACTDWTLILKTALGLEGWDMKEILSALETLAISRDIARENKTNEETTKVLVCVDGLEEDIENWDNWYARIRQCDLFLKSYPRICFMFTARKYFLDNEQLPTGKNFRVVELPREGDVPVRELYERYFKEYNITFSTKFKIRGLDNAFALRLFCEEYENTEFKETDEIVTATNELLSIKIDKMDKSFVSKLNLPANSRYPIRESVSLISNYFYSYTEIEHNVLVTNLKKGLGNYLNNEKIELLIEFLAQQGILIKSTKTNGSGALKIKINIYSITYQSIIEFIIADRIIVEINNNILGNITTQLDRNENSEEVNKKEIIPIELHTIANKRIEQNIVNSLFLNESKLIEETDLIFSGYKKEQIFYLRMHALVFATESIAIKYKSEIDGLFFGSKQEQYKVLKYLILPASTFNNYFGAEYLHSILINQSSVFDRDNLWTGSDKFKSNEKSTPQRVIEEINSGEIILSEYALHNETPLIYAWALSTLNQEFRNNLRTVLTKWALKQPQEFVPLLEKVFLQSDPQIQEDLASITLALAGKLKDLTYLKQIAEWGLNNIFSNLSTFRNIIVRQGFRAIAEKAFLNEVISQSQVLQARPYIQKEIILLPLDKAAVNFSKEEVYPIVHDLAWYVIKRAYNDFLQYPSSLSERIVDRDTAEAKRLLTAYEAIAEGKHLYAHSWAMAAAIAYIKNLGFNRVNGNGFTEASHGSKSSVYTYEEKYTWLAVHFLQGYLADYTPMISHSRKGEFINDYSQISHIPNPSDNFDLQNHLDVENPLLGLWITKEVLSKEVLDVSNITSEIKKLVKEEPTIDFYKWLFFNDADFLAFSENNEWVGLYNYTSIPDSKNLHYTRLDAKACIIKSACLEEFISQFKKDPDNYYFINSIDRLHGYPDTDTYSSPSDIVWMNWIAEYENTEPLYLDDINEKLDLTLTRVIEISGKGESELMLPSKKIRELLTIIELHGQFLKNNKNEVIGVLHNIKGENYDEQEIVFIQKELLLNKLKERGEELIWFVDLYKSTDISNHTVERNHHTQKSSKYIVYFENNELRSHKFWSERATNVRDSKME